MQRPRCPNGRLGSVATSARQIVLRPSSLVTFFWASRSSEGGLATSRSEVGKDQSYPAAGPGPGALSRSEQDSHRRCNTMNHSKNEQLMARKAAATPRGVGVMGTSSPTVRQRRALGRRRQPLHRLRRRHRGDEHRPPPPEGDRCDRGAARALHAHLLPGRALRELCRAGREAQRLTPGSHEKKTALFSTGAEAIENAIKIARYHTKRAGVIAFGGAFHGRTCSRSR